MSMFIVPGLNKNRIYHYTSAKKFLNILNAGALWLTHYKFLKDSDEIQRGFKIIQAAIDRKFPKSGDPLIQQLLDVTKRIPQEYFISCFCPTPTNDYLWHNYGEEYRGVVIEFDATNIVHTVMTTNETYQKFVDLAPVDYNLNEFRGKVERQASSLSLPPFFVYDRAIFTRREDLKEVHGFIPFRNLLSENCAYATLLKDPRYQEENEWRIVHSPSFDYRKLDIITLKGAKRAILPISYLPITRIILGQQIKRKIKENVIDAANRLGIPNTELQFLLLQSA